jgi:hydroxypyruvate isomerase
MPKLAANVSMLFSQLDFLDRFAAARAAGFRAVEYQFPYDHDAKEVARRVRDAGVEVVLHNLPLGGNPKVERGIACLPGREREFRDNVERGLEYAVAAGCPRLNCISGIAPADKEHLDVLVGNLRYADVVKQSSKPTAKRKHKPQKKLKNWRTDNRIIAYLGISGIHIIHPQAQRIGLRLQKRNIVLRSRCFRIILGIGITAQKYDLRA